MKIPLATAAEKVGSVFSLLVLAALTAVLLYMSSGAAFWLILAVCLLLLGLLGIYTVAVFWASAVADEKERVIYVRGMGAGMYDVAGAVSVRTEEVRLGSLISRRIALRDAYGAETASISTLITAYHGACAEVAAKALADALRLEFVPTVERYLYDRQAKKEMKQSDKKTGGKPAEKRTVPVEAQPEINYDELDDRI